MSDSPHLDADWERSFRELVAGWADEAEKRFGESPLMRLMRDHAPIKFKKIDPLTIMDPE